ncbi:MAG: hypothetical protein VYE77_11740 [Planctomycetota bacterium]|nr:hypothetical protein [Planctomycetota bacterium]
MAHDICECIASGAYLRDYCRRPGTPATRTVYAWAAKDPAFRRAFQQARDFGEEWIRESYVEAFESPAALLAAAGDRAARRDFRRRYIRPIDLRLQRWRRHPRK